MVPRGEARVRAGAGVCIEEKVAKVCSAVAAMHKHTDATIDSGRLLVSAPIMSSMHGKVATHGIPPFSSPLHSPPQEAHSHRHQRPQPTRLTPRDKHAQREPAPPARQPCARKRRGRWHLRARTAAARTRATNQHPTQGNTPMPHYMSAPTPAGSPVPDHTCTHKHISSLRSRIYRRWSMENSAYAQCGP